MLYYVRHNETSPERGALIVFWGTAGMSTFDDVFSARLQPRKLVGKKLRNEVKTPGAIGRNAMVRVCLLDSPGPLTGIEKSSVSVNWPYGRCSFGVADKHC